MKQPYLDYGLDLENLIETITEQKEEFIADFIIDLLGKLEAKKLQNTVDYINYGLCDAIKAELHLRLTIGENK